MPISVPGRDQGRRPISAVTEPRRTRLLIHAIVVAGLVFVLGLWAEAFTLIGSEHRAAVAHAGIDARNLSAAFQEEVSSRLDGVAAAMKRVAARMRAQPGDFDLHAWAGQIPRLPAATVRAVIIGPDGRLLSSTADSHPRPIDLSNREEFRIHLDGTYHGLFIGKPVLGRSPGEAIFHVSRRVDAADGRFLGVIAFSVAPAQLTTLQRAINLRPHDMIALFGTDHIIRARFSGDSPDGMAGAGVALPPLPAGVARGSARDGTHIAESAVDHVVRVYSDRRLAGYPLFVAVGLDLGAVLAPARAHARQIEATAAAVTLLLCGLLAALIREVRRRARNEIQLAHERSALAADIVLRNEAERQLREKEQRFQDIAEVSGDWIWESDAQHRLTFLADDAFVERTGLNALGTVGKTRWELAGADPAREEKWCQHKAELDAHRPFRMFRYAVTTAAGEIRHFAVSGKPVFGAGGSFLGYRGTATNETPMIEALRRAEQAETLLRDALDSTAEGFVIFDSDDRLVLCNAAYRRMYPASAHLMVPGVMFEVLVRNSVNSGHYPDAAGHEEEWVANFLRIHREAVAELETQTREGRWILASERRMRSGGLAGLRVDITELKRIQGALRDSERRLRDFAEMASDWFWEQDADFGFVWHSEGPGAVILPPEPYFRRTRWALYPDGAAPEQWEAHKADLAARRSFRDFRYHAPDRNGRVRHISIHGVPVFDSAGGFAGYRGIGRDITAQIEAEQELKQAKERAEQAETLLRDAVDSISEGFVIFDRDDRFVMCNEVYRQIYADGADLLVPGVSFEEIVRHVVAKGGNVDAHGREAEWRADRMRQHREAKGSKEHQRANGAWYLATDRRMQNGGIAGLRIDITALKQAQAALGESEARLDRAQAIAGIGSWELDAATGRYIWSKELYRIRGVSPESFKPNIDNVAQYVHQDDYPVVRRWLANLMEGREQNALEPKIVRPDGEVRVLRVEGRAVTDPGGAVLRVAGTMQDITERRLIERQLAQAQKMEAIGNLTGGMAHDFNNVLGVIIGNLDLLKRLIRDNAAATELCGEALDGASRCTDLIRRLLAFARRQSLRPEITDMNALVGDVARLLGRILGEDIAMNLHLDAGLQPVLADPSQLEAALVNFATNARDAMPKGGRLDISTSNVVLDASYAALHPEVSPGGYVRIEISDTGSGIPPEIIGRIFEPFFTTKEPGKGTGLGLSMAFGFVKQSGGHLAVYSEPGLGTTFRVYLPNGMAEDTAPVLLSAAGPVAGGAETVLVVEDNTQLRQATVRQLTALGYRVLEAECAAAAMAVLSGAQVDLLFTDLVMPGSMDGLDLAHRAISLHAGLKVLLTSGFPGVRGAQQRMADCPFPMLNKPSRQDELARMVREVLDSGDAPAANAAARPFAWPAGRLYCDDRAGEGERV
ncbi:MAG TPA: PAS-domain containing protein [Acetobacteraceae bacterium]|nr:PAS-domain containing protein [Acetobacteraceae bacterium]